MRSRPIQAARITQPTRPAHYNEHHAVFTPHPIIQIVQHTPGTCLVLNSATKQLSDEHVRDNTSQACHLAAASDGGVSSLAASWARIESKSAHDQSNRKHHFSHHISHAGSTTT
jgi:hypothetical protein